VQTRTLEAGGQQTASTETEGDGRAVILVHGNSSSSGTWQQLLARPFGRRYRCLALDLPGHGQSARARRPDTYSLPGYAAILTEFAGTLGAGDAVIVGWSLGGHIALEAAPALPDAAGFVVFGAPPVASADQLGVAFLPNPAMNTGFTAEVSPQEARNYAASFVAPGSGLPLDAFVEDILATDGSARTGLLASISAGQFADELAIVAALRQPLAIVHGVGEQLVSLDYLRTVTAPGLWRGDVQLIGGAGHAPQQENPDAFASVLEQFIADLG
jgi:pimeloyl-ACP methyl ester carboxylesterase